MKIFLRRALIDCEAALATMNRVSRHRFADNFGRRGEPLLYVPPAVLFFFIFYGTNSLPGQESVVLAGLFGARLDCFGLNAGKASFDHYGLPPGVRISRPQSYGTAVLLVNLRSETVQLVNGIGS